jgi:chromosome segregation ATPase
MNNENIEKELKYLIEAISLVRNELKETNQKLNKLEKRIGASFPSYKELKHSIPKIIEVDNNKENLLKTFEELKAITKEKGDIGFSLKRKEYSDDIIKAVALELGVPGGRKMGINKAITGIKNCIRESISLSE